MKITRRSKAQRCAYCHGDGSVEPCPSCGCALHSDCWVEARRCPTPGCHVAAGVTIDHAVAGTPTTEAGRRRQAAFTAGYEARQRRRLLPGREHLDWVEQEHIDGLEAPNYVERRRDDSWLYEFELLSLMAFIGVCMSLRILSLGTVVALLLGELGLLLTVCVVLVILKSWRR